MVVDASAYILDAFGIGWGKMADMSNTAGNLLQSTHEDFIGVDTLCPAMISHKQSTAIHLPIFKQWNLMDLQLLADADGQKLPTHESTIRSRYSKKFLGKEPGLSVSIVINTCCCECQEYWA
ncbi:Tn3 family transposase [Legionella pneumophila]|nr:Tn3 family transposase [Legionella pneumophila]